jgi:hypothetical protein
MRRSNQRNHGVFGTGIGKDETMTQPVTKITADATLDNLSLQDYQDMVQDLRTTLSLDKLIAVLNSQYSKPLWSKVEKGEVAPNRNQRNELRRHYGMPPLPPTVAEATAAASPDAAVWQVGEGVPDVVIMVTAQEPITLYVNGSVSVGDENATMSCLPVVTPVTPTRRQVRNAPRPFISNEQEARQKWLLDKGVAVSWREVINKGLETLEREIDNG